MKTYAPRISPNDNSGWRIHHGEMDRINEMTKEESIAEANRIVAQHKLDILLFKNKYLGVTERNSYGRDPFPPRIDRFI